MHKKQTNGYSIVEIIVYLAIFAFMSIAVINSFIVVLGSYSNTRTNRDLLESGGTVIERISREIRQAKGIDVVGSTLSSNPGVLQLNSITSAGVSTVMKFSVSSGALNLYQDGTLVGNLLGQNVSVTTLIFRRITTSNGEAVKVELTLQDTRSKIAQSVNFYNTVILRGAY